jgi:hypothetical protein
MIERTTTKTVTFLHPFVLSGIDELQPAGSYIVETDEELIQTLSFPAYRSTGTWIRLPSQGRSATFAQAVKLTPAELGAALARDALLPPTVAAQPSGERLPADRVKPRLVRRAASTMDALNQGFRCVTAHLARAWRY